MFIDVIEVVQYCNYIKLYYQKVSISQGINWPTYLSNNYNLLLFMQLISEPDWDFRH